MIFYIFCGLICCLSLSFINCVILKFSNLIFFSKSVSANDKIILEQKWGPDPRNFVANVNFGKFADIEAFK